MNDDEKYLFDLNGYLVIEGVLTREEIDISNQAIDRYSEKMRIRSREERLDGNFEGSRSVWISTFISSK